MRLTLDARRPVATMTLHNAGAQPSSLQMRVFAWRQADGEDVLTPTDAVIANPGGMELAAGADQLARFGLRPGMSGDAYRVVIQELPRPEDARPGQVATLLRISVPIFVEPTASAPALTWRATAAPDGVQLSVRNDGTAHAQVVSLAVRREGAVKTEERSVAVYILPGAERLIHAPLESPPTPGERITVSATTDGDPQTAQLTVEAAGGEPARR